jgi:hypothetical protein
MNPQIKTNAARLHTNLSTYGAILVAVLGYLAGSGAKDLEDLAANFSWPRAVTMLSGLAIFLVTRVLPQYAPADVQTPAPAADDAQEPQRDE